MVITANQWFELKTGRSSGSYQASEQHMLLSRSKELKSLVISSWCAPYRIAAFSLSFSQFVLAANVCRQKSEKHRGDPPEAMEVMEVCVCPVLLITSESRGLLHPATSSGSVCFNNREEVISAITQAPNMCTVSPGVFIKCYFDQEPLKWFRSSALFSLFHTWEHLRHNLLINWD